MYYSNYVGRFPDEITHISYVAYLQETNKIIPEFKDMTVLESTNAKSPPASALTTRNNLAGTFRFGEKFNTLCHPPLYYQIMRLSGGISISNGNVVIHLFRLRLFTMGIACLAMLLVFYIGWSRIGKNPFFHLLYAVICVSVPMLAYDCAGVNNDTLSLLFVTIFTLGLLRFSEKQRTTGTYFLIGAGVLGAFLSKLTSGIIVSVTLALFVLYLIFKEKNIKFIFSRQFLASLPFYAVTGAYFIAVKLQTGSFQPDFLRLSPDKYYTSAHYKAPTDRKVMNLHQYIGYFFDNFTQTWVSIQAHVSLNKSVNYYDISTIALVIIMFLPLFAYIKLHYKRSGNPMAPVIGTMYLSTVATVLLQFYHGYNEFKNVSGYEGGFQSRYYLCCIAMFGLGSVWAFKKLYGRDKRSLDSASQDKSETGLTVIEVRRASVNIVCVAFSGLLIYEDFIYFILNFKDYL